MPRKAETRGKNLGNALRGGLVLFFEKMRKEGKTTSDIWAEIFEEDAAAAMRLAISLTPKEMDLSVTNEDAPVIIDAIDWQMMREAKIAQEASSGTTH